MDKYVIILAAGKGQSMNSLNPEHSKVSYPILGKPMIHYVLDAIKPFKPKEVVTVVGFGGDVTKQLVEGRSKVVWQKDILGTAHAVKQCEPILGDKKGVTLVMYGDTPLIPSEVLGAILHNHEKNHNDLTIVSAVLSFPGGYGRIIREHKSNKVLAIREEKDCNNEELYIDEVNTGICVINNELLWEYLPKVSRNNAKKLYYLSELVQIFVKDHLKVGDYVVEHMVDAFGINNRVQLAYANKVMRKRVNTKLMLSGVSIEDPDTAYISPDVKIGRDTIIYPNTSISGDCKIGDSCQIGPNVSLTNVIVGNGARIHASHLENVKIKAGEYVGPYKNIDEK